MYAAFRDPYLYPGTEVLKNRLGTRDAGRLARFEAEMTRARAAEPFPRGRLSVTHFKAFHRHLFQDVYVWAGRIRTVRLAKDASMFCYPEHIASQLHSLFAGLRAQNYLRGLSRDDFAVSGARFLSALNAIHAFREGNGRTQLSFFSLVADQAGHPLNLTALDPPRFLAAMIASFGGDGEELESEIRNLL